MHDSDKTCLIKMGKSPIYVFLLLICDSTETVSQDKIVIYPCFGLGQFEIQYVYVYSSISILL